MTWQITSNDFKQLSEKNLEDLGMKMIRSNLTGKPLGREGWKVLHPKTVEGSDGISRLFLSSAGGSFGEPGNYWASRDENDELKRDPFMTSWCKYHSNCNEEGCVSGQEGCHAGKPSLNKNCGCGIYAWSRLSDAIKHGGDENMPIIVRLAHLGPNIRTDMQKMIPRYSDQQESDFVYTGPMGVRSYQAHLTGIVHPNIPNWFNSETSTVKNVISKLSKAYGNVPILKGDDDSQTSAQVLAGALEI